MEKEIERYLVEKVKNVLGGLCLKFISPSMRGVPDRIVLLPGGGMFLVELKDKGKRLRSEQVFVHQMLLGLGFAVYTLDTKESIDEVIEKWNIGLTSTKH